MTVQDALRHAQEIEPLDLAARVEHIHMHIDRCDDEERSIWQEALHLTRYGSKIRRVKEIHSGA